MQNNIQKSSRKNLHIPLTEDLYACLEKEAKKQDMTLTSVAREAISQWFASLRQKELDDSVKKYAMNCAGVTDLDVDLEKAGVAHLLEKSLV